MKTIRFSCKDTIRYKCSEPGDQSGDYVKAEEARKYAETYTAGMNALSKFTTELEQKQAERIAELEKALDGTLTAIAHLEVCGSCAMDSWNCCEGGSMVVQQRLVAAEVLKKGKP